jgi:hypothetical protein
MRVAMCQPAKHLVILFVLLIASGCAQTSVLTPVGKTFPADKSDRILLMPPDIELSEMTASGMLELRADWTASGLTNVTAALIQELKAHHDTMVKYEEPPEGSVEFHEHQQIIKLHEVVGHSILLHKYSPNLQLPTKENTFDWSLGQTVTTFRKKPGADYALFIFMRDSYASGSRVALGVVLAVAGIGIPMGRQVGFASLVDLQTGEIVWFNRMISGKGDLRTPEPARNSVKRLLTNFPL